MTKLIKELFCGMKKMDNLKIGDKIGLIAPSGNPKSIKNIKEIVNILKNRGFIPIFNEKVLSQDINEKVKDIHTFFSDPSIKAIFTLRGGFSCNEVLEFIDYSLVKNNKKIFVGFSDITNLLIAFNKKSGLNTIHGPIFSEKKYLGNDVLNVLFMFLLGKYNLSDLLSKMNFEILKSSKSIKGELLGGNLFVLNNLIGTSYEPDWSGKILFIESIELSQDIILSILEHFKQVGIFNKVVGLIIGDLGNQKDFLDKILEKLGEFNGFVLKTKNIGHVKHNYPIPLGELVEWDGNLLK